MTARAQLSNFARITVALGLMLAVVGVLPTVASAAPKWHIDAMPQTNAAPDGTVDFAVQLTNVGNEAVNGSAEPLHLTATMPSSIQVTALKRINLAPAIEWGDCSVTPLPTALGAPASCTSEEELGPLGGANFFVVVDVIAHVDPAASEGIQTATFQISGGGASNSPSTVAPVRITAAPTLFGIDAFDRVDATVAGGASTLAGAHPADDLTSFDFNTITNPAPLKGVMWPVEPAKDTIVDLPPGLIGNPTAVAQCTASKLVNSEGTVAKPLCPPASQVGTALVRVNGGQPAIIETAIGPLPVFNMAPPPGAPARFGFNVAGTVVTLDADLRSGSDYGISVTSRNISQGLPIAGTTVDFWGTPSASIHTPERACAGDVGPYLGGHTCEAGTPEVAFFRNPTSCTGSPLTSAIHADSWDHPGPYDAEGRPVLSDPRWQSATAESHEGPGYPFAPEDWGAKTHIEGCDAVPFTPDITVQPTTHAADSPTGLSVDLTMPQEALRQPGAIAQADVKDSTVTQPLGTRVNPAAANGLTGCSEAQIGYLGNSFGAPNPIHFNTADPTCPDSSKIGSVEIVTPLQEDPLKGAIYQARQGENPFGSTLAFYAVAKGQGLIIKLPALVQTDPDTGQVTTVFKDNPQLPFEHYRLNFFGGPHAPLITPPTCGTKTTHSTFTGWANPDAPVQTEDSFQITSGPNGTPCAGSEAQRPFAPSFEAGTVSPLAGAFSPFVLKLSREDGMRELTGLDTTLPPGLLGRLAGVPYCSEAQIAAAEHASGLAERAAPSCPTASAVGTTDATAGAGPDPFHNPGTAYLAGPYKGAPLSLAILTPAVAGPLDLGTVVVRTALYVDQTTTQIRAVTDPLPTRIVSGGDGFPLDLRTVSVNLNRPNFTLNPTSCDPMSVSGTVAGTGGASAAVSSRFQVGNCAALPFKPKLSFRLKGSTKRGGYPAFSATLTAKPGEANIARVQVGLPRSEYLAQNHIRTVCTRVQFAASACPAGSVYGHARAITPLLDKPLEGPVYLRSSDNKLPDLVADLNGQIHVVLDGRIDSHDKGIRNTFSVVPDAPVTKFTLTMQGDKKGLLQNSRNLCKSTNRASVQMDGQNGKTHDFRPVLKSHCAKAAGS